MTSARYCCTQNFSFIVSIQNLLSGRHTPSLGISIQPLDYWLPGTPAVDPARDLSSRDGPILMESLAVDKPS